MDYKKLIERLYKSFEAEALCADAVEAIEALQARVTELEDAAFVSRGMLRLAHGERDAALAKLKELEAKPSPTALELMREYSNDKQWALEEAAKGLTEADVDLFWNDDDPEQPYESVDEFLNHEICSGIPLAVGELRTVQRAIRLPNITIRITSIDDEECEADYEIVEAQLKEGL